MGEMSMLVATKPVHDSAGSFRFCVGLQLDLTAHSDADTSGTAGASMELLWKVEHVLRLLPSVIDIAKPSGLPVHERHQLRHEVGRSHIEMLKQVANPRNGVGPGGQKRR